MSADDPKVPPQQEESPDDGVSREARRARNRAKLDAARERACQTVEAMRERRRLAVRAWACVGDVPHEVVMAAARVKAAADGMPTEIAFCMLQAEGQTKH